MNNWFARTGKGTGTIIGINALVFLADLASGGNVQNLLALSSATAFSQPWTLVTYGFAHSGFIHIILNLYSIWIFGEVLENILGLKKFVTLYMGSVIGGGLAVAFFSSYWVIGASGGVFGLMAAYFVVMRAMGYRSSQMLVLIAINIFMGFTIPGVSMEAHIGGLLAGGAIAWYYTQARR